MLTKCVFLCLHIKEVRLAVSSPLHRINSVAVDSLIRQQREKKINKQTSKTNTRDDVCPYFTPHTVTLSSHGCDPCCGDSPVAPGVMEDELVAPARYPAGI